MADAGTAPKKKRTLPPKGDRCLNCGLQLDTNFCPDCGQHNTSHNHGFGQFLQEFLEEFVRFDSKLIRTIVPLLTKPGFLTQEWVAGKRVRYITPLKLYITMSAVCFLAISLRTQFYGPKPTDFNFSVNKSSVGKPEKALKEHKKGDTALDDLFTRKFGTATESNLRDISEKFESRLPTMNFAIMPIIAGIFYLLYIRKKRFYVEHLVFTLHYYSFAFVVATFTSMIPLRLISGLGLIWMLGYLPIALVKNYGQNYLKTFAKLFIFGIFYALVLAGALFATLVATALALPDKPAALPTNGSIVKSGLSPAKGAVNSSSSIGRVNSH